MTASKTELARLLGELAELPAPRRLERVLTEGEPGDVLVALGDEAERLVNVEVRRALDASQLVTSLADEARLPQARARARRAKAQALAPAGRFEEALELCHEAEGIAGRAGLVVEGARARLASLNALAHLGRYAEAVAAGESAREAFESSGEPKLAARADLNLGATHQMRDSVEQALFHYDRARGALLDEPEILAQLDSNRGHALMCLDDFAGSEAAFRSAGEAFRLAEMSMGAAVVEGNLADLATRQGRLARALAHFERARRHLEKDSTPGHLARLTAEKADALAELGLWEDARRSYDIAIPGLDAHGLTGEAARARAGLGRALVRLGESDAARAAFDDASRAFEDLGHRSASAQVELARDELVGHSSDAERRLEEALAVLAQRPALAAVARYRLALRALESGDSAAAAAQLDAAFPAARELDLAPLLADLHHLRGLVHEKRGESSEAISELRSAVEQVERLRGSLQAERFRAAFLGQRLAAYEDLALAALGRGPAGTPEAFRAVELAKSRALLDRVSGALDLEDVATGSTDPGDDTLVSELARLRAKLNWLYSRLSGPSSDDGTDDGSIGADWKTAVRECERELAELEDRLVVSAGVPGLYARPSSLEAVQDRLAEDEAVVEYYMPRGELLAFVVRRDRVDVHRALDDRTSLIEKVRRVQFQLQRAVRGGSSAGPASEHHLASVRRELQGFRSAVWEPLEESLSGVRRIAVVPHGPLHTVPFPALWNGSSYLVDEYEITYAPSATVRMLYSEDAHDPCDAHDPDGANVAGDPARGDGSEGHDGPNGGAVIVGVPDEHAPNIANEAVEVAAALGTEPSLMGTQATCERVIDAARRADVLHLACHGRFLPGHPLASGLRLADRWLTVREIYSLRIGASLVTLSGCETGGNVVQAGDELVGLLRGFLAAGARSLLVSLWTVNDESTAELMTCFYRSLRAGAGPAAALRTAQTEVRARRPHPAFWAPFVLGGKP